MDSQANSNIAKQFDNIPQVIINEKQESYQRKEFLTNQFILDRPITDRPMSTNDASDEKLTISNPIEHKQSNEKREKKEVQRLSTTDSMQEFLEIPDNIPSDKYMENEEEEET